MDRSAQEREAAAYRRGEETMLAAVLASGQRTLWGESWLNAAAVAALRPSPPA